MVIPDAPPPQPPENGVDIPLVDGDNLDVARVDLASSISSLESEQEIEVVLEVGIAGEDSGPETSLLVEDQSDGEAEVESAV